jgi:hypothetical protein
MRYSSAGTPTESLTRRSSGRANVSCEAPSTRSYAVTLTDSAAVECAGTALGLLADPVEREETADDLRRVWRDAYENAVLRPEPRVLRVNELETRVRAWFEQGSEGCPDWAAAGGMGVASQLRTELATAECRPRLYHLRVEQGRHEIDLLAEVAATRVVAVEVKAAAAPRADAASHLAWLRDRLGQRFVRGVVLHTGPRAYELDERILAAPIATLWA